MADHLRPVPESEADSQSNDSTRAAPRPRSQRPLPTNRLKFDVQVAALKAIAVASNYGERAVSAEDIAPRMGVVAATAGLNNAFFTAAGLIVRERKGYYKPIAATSEFARKSTFNETQAAALLGPAMQESWYFREIAQQLQMGTTTHKKMIEVLAHVAGASRDHETQLTSVLLWLEYVGLVINTNGYVQLGQRDLQELYKPLTPDPEEDTEDDGDGPVDPAGTEGKTTTTKRRRSDVHDEETVLSLTFDLALTGDDLRGLSAEQIVALFEAVGKVAAIKATMT